MARISKTSGNGSSLAEPAAPPAVLAKPAAPPAMLAEPAAPPVPLAPSFASAASSLVEAVVWQEARSSTHANARRSMQKT